MKLFLDKGKFREKLYKQQDKKNLVPRRKGQTEKKMKLEIMNLGQNNEDFVLSYQHHLVYFFL